MGEDKQEWRQVGLRTGGGGEGRVKDRKGGRQGGSRRKREVSLCMLKLS